MVNYKRLYTDASKMLESYQDEIVPGYRKMLENRVEVVRCKDCKYYRESENPEMEGIRFCYRLQGSNGKSVGYNFSDDDFCSRGEYA